MNSDWQSFLLQQGGHIEDGVVQHFGNAAQERVDAESATVLCDLSQFGLLRVSGEDAQTFLQNLLSNDIRETEAGRAQLSSFNNAKGRMLASMLVWRDGADYLLQLHASLIEPIRKKLSMYVLRSKVKIADISPDQVILGVAGPRAEAALQQAGLHVPTDVMGMWHANGSCVLRREAARFEIITDVQQAQASWVALASAARPVGAPCWDGMDIRAGIPFIRSETSEAFVPQMVNFELIGGINFKKGCYPGQEVVARMHYLGKPKRRMYRARIMTETPPAPGAELFSATHENAVCGQLVSSARAAHGGYDVLAVIQTEVAEAFPVHLNALTGPRLELEPLPYALP
ncbi:MAG: folate-binding protein YgfZ [Sideroxydans sp.]